MCESLVARKGVLLLPSENYDYDRLCHFRMGYGRKNLPEALEELNSFVVEEMK